MVDTTFSAIKRRFGPACPSLVIREFRDLVFTASDYNLAQALKQ
jgi:hypothetical protein